MRIYIPTKGRLKNQLTIQNLPPELRARTTIVCPSKEAFWHTQNWPTSHVVTQPDDKMGIADKRRWILEFLAMGSEKLVMLDDDLRFAVRREDEPSKFRKAEPEDVLFAFSQLEQILSPEVPHAGFAVRGGGIGETAQLGGWQEAKRMMYSLGYHIPTVLQEAEWGRISTHEDMDICLQLLSKGFPNRVNFTFVTDQKFGNPGGCTDERTIEINNADSYKLAAFHPQFVRTSEKQYLNSPDRVEVVCSWMKALAHGLQNRK